MSSCVPAFRPGVPGLIPDTWIVAPTDGPKAPPIVVVHGVSRAADEIVDLLLPRADAVKRTLVIPHFTKEHWPRYQRAACGQRADLALLRLMAALRHEGRVGHGPFDLSGYSGGAQFAHRFTWLYPDLVGRLSAAAPGWWTFPDTSAAWPYGIGDGSPRDAVQSFWLRANLRRFLNRQIVVCVGSDDVERDDKLRQSPSIDRRQGWHRVERSRRWCAAADAAARAQGLAPRISLRVLPGCGHSFADCVANGDLDHDFIAPTGAADTPRATRATSPDLKPIESTAA